MDEELGDEVAPLDASEGALLQGKEGGFSLKSESGSFLDLCGSSSDGFANILDSKNASRSIHSLENESMDPRPEDGIGGVVEELTVKNLDDLNMTIVGTSKGTERTRTRAQCWPLLHKMSGSRGCPVEIEKEDGHDESRMWEDMAGPSLSEMLSHKPSADNQTEGGEEVFRPDLNSAGDASVVGATRTKMLSKSGFSEFFIKNTLKGKGVIQRDLPRNRISFQPQADNNVLVDTGPKLISKEVVTPAAVDVLPHVDKVSDSNVLSNAEDGVNLGEWLRGGKNDMDKMERLNLFRQIVNFVDSHHSKGIAIQVLRPSCFKLMSSNQVRYIGPGGNSCNIREKQLGSRAQMSLKRAPDRGLLGAFSSSAKKHKSGDGMGRGSLWPGLRLSSQLTVDSASGNNVRTTNQPYSIFMRGADKSNNDHLSSKNGNSLMSFHAVSRQLEEKWYSVPKGCNGGESKLASDIYCLGVLLFEMLGHFDSEKARTASMMDLHRRILPPNFLSENPREAGFLLWLLHPEPSSRPSSREVLLSDVLNGLKDACPEELSSIIEQDDVESDLLLHFLVSSKEQKQRSAYKLMEDLKCLEADIQEIAKRRVIGCSGHTCPSMSLPDVRENKLHDKELLSSHFVSQLSVSSDVTKSRLLGNMDRLETAYFSMRSRIQPLESDAARRLDCDVLRNHNNSDSTDIDEEPMSIMDQTGAFFDGLCKYVRYTKFKVRGVLRNGDFNNSSNVICSLSFNRDQDYFAAAGVSKKIKIFEFDALLNQSVDIHYPAVEMSNKSRLSCVCWNNYVTNYLASSDYDGIVKLWDATTGQIFSEYREHEKRAWSVDFSPVYPTKFASGSDDCTVKLWNINEKNRVATIRNIANVCCVQFSAHSTHLLAFGSADYRTYCYDLRNTRIPWCILKGHEKAVSYVKFLDSQTLVTASTDNTLKLWDLTISSPNTLSTGACCLTFRGHTNEKNFVGLSAANGFITCGSETNEVFTYYRSLPMPITSLKFGSIDQISGKETNDDNGQFVSSVCWRRKSDMVIAANSSGCIKVLEMV